MKHGNERNLLKNITKTPSLNGHVLRPHLRNVPLTRLLLCFRPLGGGKIWRLFSWRGPGHPGERRDKVHQRPSARGAGPCPGGQRQHCWAGVQRSPGLPGPGPQHPEALLHPAHEGRAPPLAHRCPPAVCVGGQLLRGGGATSRHPQGCLCQSGPPRTVCVGITGPQRGAPLSHHPGHAEGGQGGLCPSDPAGDAGGGPGGSVLLRGGGPALLGSLGVLAAPAAPRVDWCSRGPRRRGPLVLADFTLAGEDGAGLGPVPPAGRGPGRQVRQEKTRENVSMNLCLRLGRPQTRTLVSGTGTEAMGEFSWQCTEAVSRRRWNRHGNSWKSANISDVILKMLK